MRNYKSLDVYHIAHAMSLKIYTITKEFPKEELFSLTNQIRRASISVIANIAEGSSRHSPNDFAHFIQISIGSLAELEVLLTFAKDLSYIDEKTLEPIIEDINKVRAMLINLNKKLRL